MTDKLRQRTTRAPHGKAPTWALLLFGSCALLLAGVANSVLA